MQKELFFVTILNGDIMKTKDLAKNAIVLAFYMLLIGLNPYGFYMFQLRIGEALSVLPFFNRKFVPALILGGALANFASPLGPIDMIVGGSCAIITYALSKFIKNVYLNSLIFSCVSGLLVTLELFKTGNLDMTMKLPFLISFVSIAGSTLIVTSIACVIINKTKLKELIKNN